MFFQQAKQLPYSEVYIQNLTQRMMGAQQITKSMRFKMKMQDGSELDHLLSLLKQDGANAARLGKMHIDNRDGTKRLWLSNNIWIQYDASTEDFRFCDMVSGAVKVPFHSTRPQAMVEWTRNYATAHADIVAVNQSPFQQMMKSAGLSMQLLGMLAWLLLGALAIAWVFGKVRFF